jgi:hypothetical protein|tara:strand:- start:2071 stop:3297 length:1227 start_codon:yes stop_codon:yes gene_type:complete
MGKLFNALNGLKTNIFGGPGNTGRTDPPATRVAKIGLTDTPTSLLEVDPLAFASFSYPRDITNNIQNGHYMLFYVNVQNRSKYQYNDFLGAPIEATTQVKIKTTEYAGENDYYGTEVEKIIDVKGESPGEKVYYHNRAAKNQSNKLTGKYKGLNVSLRSGLRNQLERTGIASKAQTTTRVSDSVAIYLPPNVQDNLGATYNDMQTGMLGYAAAGALDFSKFMGNKDYAAAAKALTGGLAGIATEAAKKAASGLVEALAGAEGATQLGNRVFGQADNPYLEVLFETMAVRSFTYSFTFAPRNEEERNDVQDIIQLFRFHMAPELQGAQSRFLTLPSEFDIHYMFQAKDGTNTENDYYNRIATCVLENCTVDYTPGKVSSFKDGSPTQINMTLQFKETETLTKDKINQGY